MLNENPMVSIVIPVYNGSNYLREAIDSALGQDYENIEVIVINDGSNDGGATECIALSYGDKIRYFSKENGGVSTALNYGIDQMRGEYFSWLSHDDIYMPNKISVLIESLRKDGDMKKLVYSDFFYLKEGGELIPFILQSRSQETMTCSVIPVVRWLVSACTVLIHKSHFVRVGKFDTRLLYTQDMDFLFWAFLGQTVLYVDKALVKYRIHDNQGFQTIPCIRQDITATLNSFAYHISENEINKLPGGAYRYFYDIIVNLRFLGEVRCMNQISQKFIAANVPDGITEGLRKLENYIYSLSNGHASKIAIFCAGRIGTSFYYQLKDRLVRIDTFADNNPQKHGYLFDGISCVSKEKLKEQKDDTLVIVAMIGSDELASQLRDEGFPYVVTHYDLIGVVDETMPLKWVSGFDFIEGVDYSSKDSQLLVTHFNKLIYDVCKYYEDKLYTAKGSVDK